VVLVNPSNPRSDQLPLPLSENAGGSQQTGKSSRDGTSFCDELTRHLRSMKALRFSQLPTYVLQRVKGKAVGSSRKIIRPVQKLAISVCLRLGRPLPPSLRSQYILEIYFQAIRTYGLNSFGPAHDLPSRSESATPSDGKRWLGGSSALHSRRSPQCARRTDIRAWADP
jgi:hypothetical protein